MTARHRHLAMACALACALAIPTLHASAHQAQQVSQAVKCVPDGEHLVVSTTQVPGAIRIFDVATGKMVGVVDHPAWTVVNSRPIAVDADGHLWVGDDATQTLYLFDRRNRFVRSFVIDLSCAGNPTGSGIRSLAFGQGGTLYATASWNSGSANYLLKIDPETEKTLCCSDLDALTGTNYEPHRLAVGSDGLVYTTEWCGPGNSGQRRILVIDPSGQGGFQLVQTITSASFGQCGGTIDVMPGGSIVYGDYSAGTCWLSDSARTTWTQVASCPASPEFSNFAVGHGLIFVPSSPCGPGFGQISVFELDGTPVISFSVNAPNLAQLESFQHAVVRH